jgi:signal transduction histidine kinase
MNGFANESSDRTADASPTDSLSVTNEITPELVAYYVQRGRRLRSATIHRTLRQMGSKIRSRIGACKLIEARTAAAEDEALASLAGNLKTGLTVIGASAKMLRDHPDLDPVTRSKFAESVLAEQARLQELISQILDASNVNRRSGLWQVRLKNLCLEGEQRIS